jgi:diacylglycerol kinase (ATP)
LNDGSTARIVANPEAVDVTTELCDEVRRACEQVFPSVESVALPSGRGGTVRAVEELAREADAPTVFVAVGGDGTARDVAEGVARGCGTWPGAEQSEADASLFVVPAGSGNSFYYALWERRPWQEALASLASPGRHDLRAVDMIRLPDSDESSLIGVNVGFGALISEHLKRVGIRDDTRHEAAIGAALEEAELFPARVVVDGETVCEGDLWQATVGGVKAFMRGYFKVLPRAELDDGLLDACIVVNPEVDDFAVLTSLMPQGAHLDHDAIAYVQGSRVQIERTDSGLMAFDHDGDPRPRTRTVDLEVVPGALRVIAEAGIGDAGARAAASAAGG